MSTAAASTTPQLHAQLAASPLAQLDAGLAIARRRDGITCIAMPVAVVAASRIVDAWPDAPLAVWCAARLAAGSGDRGPRVIVGVGVARELRGHGEHRWSETVRRARGLRVTGAVIAGSAVAVDALGVARPRFLGGAAFAAGAADGAPWHGFGDAWFVLPRWTYVDDGASAQLVLAVDAVDARYPDRWREQLARHLVALSTPAPVRTPPGVVEMQPASSDEWHAQVDAITKAIADGTCSKIVAARTCSVAMSAPVAAGHVLAALDERHGDCVRIVMRPPGAATLVAATPEQLVARDGDVVRCDALAGTINANADDAATSLLASAKDRREHALVVSAIRDALDAAGAAIDAPDEPAVRRLRHVLHLHTPFRATLREPQHVLELAARLHPTPAVGGTPTRVAIDWIHAHEPAARGWYASPVGWFDLDGNGELAVAIRSGVLAGNRAHLWAGAGIVAGSDPARELAETDSKLRAMLGALGVGA